MAVSFCAAATPTRGPRHTATTDTANRTRLPLEFIDDSRHALRRDAKLRRIQVAVSCCRHLDRHSAPRVTRAAIQRDYRGKRLTADAVPLGACTRNDVGYSTWACPLRCATRYTRLHTLCADEPRARFISALSRCDTYWGFASAPPLSA